MSIGTYIQDERLKQDASVEEVSLDAKVSVGTIRAIEQGRLMPSAASLHAILGALGIDEKNHWVNATTWVHPMENVTYYLAPLKGTKSRERRTNTYDNVSDNVSELRLETIDAVMKADVDSLHAILVLLTKPIL